MNSIKLKIAAGLAATSVVALGTAYFLNKKGQKKESAERKEELISFFEGYTLFIQAPSLEGTVSVSNGGLKYVLMQYDAEKYLEGGCLTAEMALQMKFKAAAAHAYMVKSTNPKLTKQEIFDIIIKNNFDVFSIELTK